MAMWHVMVGFGIGLLATILTVIGTQRQHRAISHSTKSTYISPPGDNCTICLSAMVITEMVYLNCGHAFHQQCLNKLRNHWGDKCPTCREKI